jgi:hypothetical protein
MFLIHKGQHSKYIFLSLFFISKIRLFEHLIEHKNVFRFSTTISWNILRRFRDTE